ncbi:MAG: hypothetical protein ACFB0E_10350 [Leptolyngbyaceae cyanobacterium]
MLGIPGQSFEVFGTDLDADTVFIHSLQLGRATSFSNGHTPQFLAAVHIGRVDIAHPAEILTSA